MKRFLSFSVITTLILLVATGVLIYFENDMPILHIPRVIIGSFVVLFVPGYWITRWAFPLTGSELMMDPSTESELLPALDIPKTIDGLERTVLSIALSISSVPLILFYVNFLGVALTVWSVYFTLVGVTVFSLFGSLYRDAIHALKSK